MLHTRRYFPAATLPTRPRGLPIPPAPASTRRQPPTTWLQCQRGRDSHPPTKARPAATTRQPTRSNRQLLTDQNDAEHVAIEYELAQTLRAAGFPVPDVFPTPTTRADREHVRTKVVRATADRSGPDNRIGSVRGRRG